MTNRIELNWDVPYAVDEQRYYCSATPIDPEDLPAPKAVLAGDVRAHVDTSVSVDKVYYALIGSVKNSIEKLSPQVRVSTSRLTKSIKALFSASEKGSAYNFQDISTLWQDVEATIPVTAVDQFIARVDDISGNGNHLIQANAVKRPQLKQDEDGFYAWFDGTKVMQTSAVMNLAALSQFSAFVQTSRERTVDEVIVESSLNYNDNVGSFCLSFVPTALLDIGFKGAGTYPGGYNFVQIQSAADALYVIKFDQSAAIKIKSRVNGINATDSTLNNTSTAFANHVLYVGGRAGTSYLTQTKMRALVLLGRTTTTQEVENIEQLLAI